MSGGKTLDLIPPEHRVRLYKNFKGGQQHMAAFHGGCSCGSVRFTVDNYLYVIACHCDACKKRTGTPCGVSVVVEKENIISVKGETKTYVRTAESGRTVDYEFCPNCATTISWQIKAAPTRRIFAAGAFDDMSNFVVAGEMYTSTALPWARIGCELSRENEPDTEFRTALIEASNRSRPN